MQDVVGCVSAGQECSIAAGLLFFRLVVSSGEQLACCWAVASVVEVNPRGGTGDKRVAPDAQRGDRYPVDWRK